VARSNVSFLLRQISEHDRQAIMLDAKRDLSVHAALSHHSQHGEFPKIWAIDEAARCYLMRLPAMTAEEVGCPPYLFCADGSFLRFWRDGWFGNHFFFQDRKVIENPRMAAWTTQILEAFVVYGAEGNGPLNAKGDPEFSVSPAFGVRP